MRGLADAAEHRQATGRSVTSGNRPAAQEELHAAPRITLRPGKIEQEAFASRFLERAAEVPGGAVDRKHLEGRIELTSPPSRRYTNRVGWGRAPASALPYASVY